MFASIVCFIKILRAIICAEQVKKAIFLVFYLREKLLHFGNISLLLQLPFQVFPTNGGCQWLRFHYKYAQDFVDVV